MTKVLQMCRQTDWEKINKKHISLHLPISELFIMAFLTIIYFNNRKVMINKAPRI